MDGAINSRLAVLGLVSALAGFGCSDAQTGGTGSGVGGGVTVVTTLDAATVAVGGTVTVTCQILDGNNGGLDAQTQFAYTPTTGLSRGDGNTLIAETPGTYDIRCSAPTLGLTDGIGAMLTVIDGNPAAVTTMLDPSAVKVGEESEVTCTVTDTDGTAIAVATHVTAGADVTVDGNRVSSNVIGGHEITCHATGFSNIEEKSATLTVLSGDPVAVELRVKPEKSVYKIGNILTFSWVGVDEEGNDIEGLPGTLTLPLDGFAAVDVSENKYRAVAEGEYPASVKLHAPFDGLSDEKPIIVDGTPPKVMVTFPERGVQIQGNGDPVTVTGTIVEEVGTIDSFLINDQAVGIGEDGTFSVDITPEWGVNLIEVYTKDSNGNQGKLTPSFQYSEGFTSFVNTDAEGVKVPDGLEIMLGETFLDDGVHDHQDIDDMATLLEVLLTNLDLEQVLNDAFSGLGGSQPLGDIAGFEADFSYTLQVVPPTDIGVTTVALDSIPGGIKFDIEIGDNAQPGLDLTMQLQGLITVTAPFVGSIGEASLNLNTGLTIDKMKISGVLMMNKPEGGDLTADLNDLDMELEGIQVDPIEDVFVEMQLTPPFVNPITANFNLSDLIDINALTDSVLDPVIASLSDVILTVLEPALNEFAGSIIEIVLDSFGIKETLDVPNFLNPSAPSISVEYYTEMSSVKFDDPGAELGLGIGFYTEKGVEKENLGAIQRFSCLADYPSEFEYDWAHELALALRTDALNGLFYAIWWSGLLNGPLDLGGLAGGAGLPIPVDTMGLTMNFAAPPVINDCSKASGVEIQVGDLFLDLSGSLLGIELDADAYVDLSLIATFKTKEDGFYIEVGDLKNFDVEVVEVGPAADYEEMRGLLEDELPTILSAFLVGQEFGPIALPVIDLGESVPGVPQGSVLKFQDLEIGKTSGYVLVEGELD